MIRTKTNVSNVKEYYKSAKEAATTIQYPSEEGLGAEMTKRLNRKLVSRHSRLIAFSSYCSLAEK